MDNRVDQGMTQNATSAIQVIILRPDKNDARVLGKNTIITSSMISINDVFLHRAFHIGLKKTQVLRDRGGEFCFKCKKTSYCSRARFIPLTKFLLPCTNWRTTKSLEKSPSNTVSFTWQEFM